MSIEKLSPNERTHWEKSPLWRKALRIIDALTDELEKAKAAEVRLQVARAEETNAANAEIERLRARAKDAFGAELALRHAANAELEEVYARNGQHAVDEDRLRNSLAAANAEIDRLRAEVTQSNLDKGAALTELNQALHASEHPEGEWVCFEDAKEEVERLRTERDCSRENADAWCEKHHDAEEQLADAEKQRTVLDESRNTWIESHRELESRLAAANKLLERCYQWFDDNEQVDDPYPDLVAYRRAAPTCVGCTTHTTWDDCPVHAAPARTEANQPAAPDYRTIRVSPAGMGTPKVFTMKVQPEPEKPLSRRGCRRQ